MLGAVPQAWRHTGPTPRPGRSRQVRPARVARARGGARIVSRGSSPPTSGRIPLVRQGCWGCPGRSPLVSYGVTVNVVPPGYVATGSQLEFEAAAAAAGPLGRSATPDEIAAGVMSLAHESASFGTGSTLVTDGGHGLPETWPRP
ncbi:SDR family oxidoreductase [Streptomyces canus]|uniref:SDR family oxidoreductase n=1 Tax=Streptomyces canus TaxID=58343 RepID=UPI0038668EA2